MEDLHKAEAFFASLENRDLKKQNDVETSFLPQKTSMNLIQHNSAKHKFPKIGPKSAALRPS